MNGTMRVRVSELERTRLWPDNLNQFESISTHGNNPGVEALQSPQRKPYTLHGLERHLLAVEIGIGCRLFTR